APAARCAFSSSSSTAFASLASSPRSSIARSGDSSSPAESRSSSARTASSRESSSSALLNDSSALTHDPPKNPIHQLCRCLACIPLREPDRLVEDDFDRHLTFVELL